MSAGRLRARAPWAFPVSCRHHSRCQITLRAALVSSELRGVCGLQLGSPLGAVGMHPGRRLGVVWRCRLPPLQPPVPVQTPGVRRTCPTCLGCCAPVLSRLSAEAALSKLRLGGGGTGRGCPLGAAENQ